MYIYICICMYAYISERTYAAHIHEAEQLIVYAFVSSVVRYFNRLTFQFG